MFKLMKKRMKNEKGLTLVEVLAVVVILAIVAAIAIPAIGNMIENSRVKAMKADAINMISAAHIYYTDGNTDPFTEDPDVSGEYIDTMGSMTAFEIDEKGVMTSGTAVRGSVTLTFAAATVDNIDPENKEVDNTFVSKE